MKKRLLHFLISSMLLPQATTVILHAQTEYRNNRSVNERNPEPKRTNFYYYPDRVTAEITINEEDMPELPRFGMKMALHGEFDRMRSYGQGTHENYRDRMASAFIGLYEGSVPGQYTPYTFTQKNGNKTDVRWVELSNNTGRGLRFEGIQPLEVNAQTQSIPEKLGYPPDARLLIVHADDAGVSHSTNEAVIRAFEQGAINSTAIMVPCPWFPEIARFAKNNHNKDFGLHLTFSSEWHGYKWGGVAPASAIKSILTEEGYFYSTNGGAVKHALVNEVETELRAQIEKALAAGITPSHFDTHMNTLLGSVDLLKLYLRLGKEYRVPVMMWNDFTDFPDSFLIPEVLEYPGVNVYESTPDVEPKNWNAYYSQVLSELPAGISVLILHLAVDNAETRAMTEGHDYYDAKWRQRDLDYILSKKFKKSLKSNDIQLITWGDIKEVMYPE